MNDIALITAMEMEFARRKVFVPAKELGRASIAQIEIAKKAAMKTEFVIKENAYVNPDSQEKIVK